VFSRFSRPRSRLLFSDVLVVGRYRNQAALMLRVASRRNRAMTEVAARLTALHRDGQESGISRRFVNLPLVRDNAPLLALSWTLIHIIKPDGPLAGLEALVNDDPNLSIIASVSGIDETIAAEVSARKLYTGADIRFDHAFVDIISLAEDGRITLDLTRIHDAEPLPGGFGVP